MSDIRSKALHSKFVKGEKKTRTLRTKTHYRRIYLMLGEQAALPQPLQIIDLFHWFSAQDHRWSRATTRSYLAALCQMIRDLEAIKRITPQRREQLLIMLTELRRPKPYGGPPRYAACKRKNVKQEEVQKISEAALKRGRPDDLLLVDLLRHGPLLGLRPAEWCEANMHDGNLIVANGKRTNGRACGEARTIELGSMYDEYERDNLNRFIGSMRSLTQKNDTLDEIQREKLLARLRMRLRRTSVAAGVRPIAPYSLRHCAIANMKQTMSSIDVAGMVGHGSDRTAGRHYAKRRSGWRLSADVGHPSEETVARVRTTGMAQRPIFGPAFFQ